jgi:hypothetical protein
LHETEQKSKVLNSVEKELVGKIEDSGFIF